MTIEQRIAEIDEILQSGIKKDEQDRHTLEFDHESLRKERAELRRKLNQRPPVLGINMGGF